MKISRMALACFLFLSELRLGAQSSWPVPKPKDPYFSKGELIMGKNYLLNAGKLSAIYFQAVDMDSTTIQIKSYKVSIFGKGRNPDLDMASTNDSIPASVLERIKLWPAGTKIFFEYVKGMKINSGDKSMRLLPPLSISMVDD